MLPAVAVCYSGLKRPPKDVMNWNGDDPWPWQCSHSFHPKIKLDSRAELFRDSKGCLHATSFFFFFQWSQMHSQMGADWTPDDLLWCGGGICSGAMRCGCEVKKKSTASGQWTERPHHRLDSGVWHMHPNICATLSLVTHLELKQNVCKTSYPHHPKTLYNNLSVYDIVLNA